MRLEKRYGKERLDNACKRALDAGVRSYKRVENILKNKLDMAPLQDMNKTTAPKVAHENIRGAGNYAPPQNTQEKEENNDD